MTNPVDKNIFISIPFLSTETASLVYDILNVDKDLKGSVVERKLTTDGANLIINIHGSDLKKLRVSINSILKSIILITKTIELFGNK